MCSETMCDQGRERQRGTVSVYVMVSDENSRSPWSVIKINILVMDPWLEGNLVELIPRCSTQSGAFTYSEI